MKFWKRIGLGFVVWLVPFVTGFLFFGPDGEMVISETFFKTIMIVVSSLTGMILALWYFKKIEEDFVREGLLLGITWLIVHWLIDLLFVAVGFFDMSVVQYFTDIGLRYFNAPIFTVGIGNALRHLSKRLGKE